MKIGSGVLDLWLFDFLCPIIPKLVLRTHILRESMLQHLKTYQLHLTILVQRKPCLKETYPPYHFD